MRHRVAIQAASETNTAGEVAETWSTVHVAWAAIEAGAGREFFRAQQVNADLTHLVTMYNYPGLTTRHRLLWGSRVLHIDGITDPTGDATYARVQCREVV